MNSLTPKSVSKVVIFELAVQLRTCRSGVRIPPGTPLCLNSSSQSNLENYFFEASFKIPHLRGNKGKTFSLSGEKLNINIL